MKSKLLVFFVMVLLISCIALPAMADTGIKFTPDMLQEAAKETGITSEQIKNMMTYWYDHEREIIKLKSELELKSIDLDSLLASDKIDDKSVLTIVEQMNELKNKIEISDVKLMLKVLEILNPAQEKKVKELMMKESVESCDKD